MSDLTHAPRLNPEMARARAKARDRYVNYSITPEQLKRAQASRQKAMRRPGVGKHR